MVASGVGASAMGARLSTVATATGGNAASASSVSSSFLEKADSVEGESVPPSPEGDRLINGITIFLLRGGVRVDREMVEPVGGTVGPPLTSIYIPPVLGLARNISGGSTVLTLPGMSKMPDSSVWG